MVGSVMGNVSRLSVLNCVCRVFISIILINFFSPNVFASDISTFRNRLIADILDSSYSSKKALNYLKSQNENGSWSDINYQDTSNSFRAQNHYGRTLQMAVSFRKNGGTAMRNGVRNSLTYWFDNYPVQYPGWWHNTIGAPRTISKILLIMEGDISNTLITKGMLYCKKGWEAGFYKSWGAITHTGANLTDVASIHARLSALAYYDDIEGVRIAFEAMKNELNKTTSENGVQYDNSFHQHNAVLYNGNYGQVFLSGQTNWVRLGKGLSFGYSQADIDVLSELILDGNQWMIRRGAWDLSVTGRAISRKGKIRSTKDIIASLDVMIDIGAPRKSEFINFRKHLQGNADGALTGDKHFWVSDYHTHRTAGYSASVRMWSTHTNGTEEIHGENIQGRYLPYGTMVLMRDGLEFDQIFPVWDWKLLPGVTAVQNKQDLFPPSFYNLKGPTKFVGGASDGVIGVVGYNMKDMGKSGGVAKKSWFFFGDEIVALGAGITNNSSYNVGTALNQVLLRDKVTVSYISGSESILSNGQRTLKAPKWIHHDAVGYIFLDGSNVELMNRSVTGSWNSVNTNQNSDSITKNVFKLWFNHGSEISNEKYSYIVYPDKSIGAVKNYSDNIPVRIIENTPALQSVRHDVKKKTGIVFYKAGSVQIHIGLTVEVDEPCTVLIDESSSKAVKVTVSNPENTELTVEVKLKYDSGADKSLAFTLGGGKEVAGKSVTKTTGQTESLPGPPKAPRNLIISAVSSSLIN